MAMNCPNCAREMLYNDRRCPACGTDLSPYYSQQKQGCAAMFGGMAGLGAAAFFAAKWETIPINPLWLAIAGAVVGGATCYVVARAIFRPRQ
jgi:uncharacterized protein (DUF983 family)